MRAAPGERTPRSGFQPVPLSIAADATGHVYLSNPQRSGQVQQYSSDGALLANRGSFARSGSPLQPRSIATDAAGNLYVADSERDLLSVLGPDGATLRRWKADSRDVAVGAGGVVYLATGNEVQRFSPDGALLSKWGGSGQGDGQLGSVYGLDTSPSGNVYVADTVATDPAGFVYVADAGEPYPDSGGARVQKFTAAGEFVAEWGDIPPRPLARPRLFGTVPNRTTKRSATFRFTPRHDGTRFQGRLSGDRVPPELRPWRACTSPKRYAHLRPGRKLFHVRALAGSRKSNESLRSWLIVG